LIFALADKWGIWDVDSLAAVLPYRLAREWSVYFKLDAEDREERQLIARAEAEAEQKMAGMRTDPHFRRKMNG
jgi:hypothetical protein